jgi:hypothetical protein
MREVEFPSHPQWGCCQTTRRHVFRLQITSTLFHIPNVRLKYKSIIADLGTNGDWRGVFRSLGNASASPRQAGLMLSSGRSITPMSKIFRRRPQTYTEPSFRLRSSISVYRQLTLVCENSSLTVWKLAVSFSNPGGDDIWTLCGYIGMDPSFIRPTMLDNTDINYICAESPIIQDLLPWLQNNPTKERKSRIDGTVRNTGLKPRRIGLLYGH